MSVVCQIDQSTHESREDLHKHLRRLKVKQAEYYPQFEPRFCLGTGQPIPFKDVHQYLTQEFIDKDAIKRFIVNNPERGREWAINWLRKRKEEKGLIYAPSQVELRSLQCPSMPYYDSVGGYYDITRELGFKERYVSYTGQNTAITSNISDICIICDTRERLPIDFTAKTIKDTLNVGDYALNEPHDRGIRIERKSLSDMVSTFSSRVTETKDGEDSNLKRFDRELERAVKQNLYVVMIVESDINMSLGFDRLPQMRHTKNKPSHIFKNIRDMLTKYPLNFQTLFVNGRQEMSRMISKLLMMRDDIKTIDLQYTWELNKL